MTAPILRRLGGFAGLPLLSLLAPFLLLPLIARVGAVGGWAAILLGQAVGGLGGVIAGLGWSLVGPTAVARSSDKGRSEIYARSLASRLLALVVIVPTCGIITWGLAPAGNRWTAVAMAWAMALGALSPAWFSIGTGRPSGIALYEIIPRLVATGLAALLVLALREVWVYPVLLIVATLAGIAAYGRRVARIRLRDVLAVHAPRALWENRSATATVTIAGSYSNTPVLVVGVVESTQAVATYGSADRLYRFSLTAIQVLTNALQGWVSEIPVPASQRLSRRMWWAVTAHLLLGVTGLAGFTIFGPLVSRILFGEAVAATSLVTTLYGVAFLGVAANSALGRLVLIPLGKARTVLWSTATGAVMGLGAMSLLGAALGATGVAVGFALSEVAVTAVQAWAIIRSPTELRPGTISSGAAPAVIDDRP